MPSFSVEPVEIQSVTAASRNCMTSPLGVGQPLDPVRGTLAQTAKEWHDVAVAGPEKSGGGREEWRGREETSCGELG
jgi:hypothetical protein